MRNCHRGLHGIAIQIEVIVCKENILQGVARRFQFGSTCHFLFTLEGPSPVNFLNNQRDMSMLELERKEPYQPKEAVDTLL